MTTALIVREDRKWDQIVMGEVLIPDQPNSYGDIYTREAIKEFAYQFAIQGYGIDINHDNVEVGDQVEGACVPVLTVRAAALGQDRDHVERVEPVDVAVDVTGEVVLPEGTEMVMPGDTVKLTAKLISPVALEEKFRFAIREGGKTVGAGVVTKILK